MNEDKTVPVSSANNQLIAGDLCLDTRNHRVTLCGVNIPLTPKAAILLKYLMLHDHETVSREQLMKVLWCWNADEINSTRAVDMRINELRRKLGCSPKSPRFIETVFGQGYRFTVIVEKR